MAQNTLKVNPDKELVEQCLKDKDSYYLFINQFYDPLDRYIRRLGCADHQDRKDILQEVFIKAYINLASYDDSYPLSSWVYRIAHNETMSFYRKKKVRPSISMEDDLLEILADEAEDIKESFDIEYDKKFMADALEKLDPKYREVLVLRFFEDKSYDEISDILEKPPGTISTLIYRAKNELEKILKELHHE